MSKNAIDKLISSWRNLVANAQASASDVPGLSVHISKLQEVLEGVDLLSAELDSRMGLKRQSTQERQELLQQGKDTATHARLALRAHLGIRNARLVEYGARPIEPRRGKAKAEKAKPAPAAENAKPEPETSAPASPAEPTK